MKRSGYELEKNESGNDTQSFGVALMFCSLIILFAANIALLFYEYNLDVGMRSHRLVNCGQMLVVSGVVGLLGLGNLLFMGIHSCLLALPLAVLNYSIAIADLVLAAVPKSELPLAFRLVFFIGVAIFALSHLLVFLPPLQQEK